MISNLELHHQPELEEAELIRLFVDGTLACIGGDWRPDRGEPTVDESRYGLEGAGASEKGGYVNRAFVPSMLLCAHVRTEWEEER